MNDERRERYRSAIVEASYRSPLADVAADAAMAVADDENTRLREELEFAKLGNRQLRQANEAHRTENARLRAELDTANKIASLNQRLYTNAVATIRRVRTLLDMEELFSDNYLVGRIRDALNGETR